MNRLPLPTQARLLHALLEGLSIRSTSRLLGVSKNAIVRLIIDAGRTATAHHNTHVRHVRPRYVQCDENWDFIYAKEKRVHAGTLTGSPTYAGDIWTWLALDADSKLIISYLAYDRSREAARVFMHDLAARTEGRFQLSTDQYAPYAEAVAESFTAAGRPIDYAQIRKNHTAAPSPTVHMLPVAGRPDPAHTSTSLVERSNLTMRMSLRRYTRKTNAHSKALPYHQHMLAIFCHYYNFIRPHETLETTPAVAAGLATAPHHMSDWLAVIDAARPKPNRPATYRRRTHTHSPPTSSLSTLMHTHPILKLFDTS